MPTGSAILKFIRQTHLYLGVFIAPAVLFFAFTGVIQTFSLHEASKNGDYRPAKWIVVLAQIHKKQTSQLPLRKVESQSSPQKGNSDARKPTAGSISIVDRPAHSPLPLKLFFLIVGAGLVTSTCSGIYMSCRYCRNRFVLVLLALAGTVIPLFLTIQ
jgi:hypothetical protein